MNLIVSAPTWLIAFLALALVGAAIEDATRLKISNLTCAAVFVSALVAMALHGFSLTLWQNALVCIAILAIGTVAFANEWLGGGDVKLLAAIGLWFDLGAAVGLIAAVFIAGGLVAVIYIATRRLTRAGRRSRKTDRRVPYGVAITVGTLFIVAAQMNQPGADPFIERLKAEQAARR